MREWMKVTLGVSVLLIGFGTAAAAGYWYGDHNGFADGYEAGVEAGLAACEECPDVKSQIEEATKEAKGFLDLLRGFSGHPQDSDPDSGAAVGEGQ